MNWSRLALVLGVLGGIIGVVNAIWALVAVGGDPAYQPRLIFGIVALLAAAVGGIAALQIAQRPRAGSVAMVVLSIVGFIAINLFYINTFYILILPFFWLGALFALFGAQKRHVVI